MTRRNTIGWTAAALLAFACGTGAFVLRARRPAAEPVRQAPTAVSTNAVGRTATLHLSRRTVRATGFPADFCTHQQPSVRGTAPYAIALDEGVSKIDALRAVRQCGARTIGPLPPNALLVETSSCSLKALAANASFTAATEWLPEDKVEARLRELLATGCDTLDVTVVALAASDLEGILRTATLQGGERLTGCLNGKTSLTLRLPRTLVQDLVARGDVRWIESFTRPRLLNDRAVNPVTMNVRTVWDTRGLTGAGQVVTTSDSGIDTGDLETLHADLRNRLLGFRKVDAACMDTDEEGHGTHTAGSIVGDGTMSDGQIRGVAYGAQLWAWFCAKEYYDYQKGQYYTGIDTPDTCDSLFRPDGATDACIHSASWGEENQGAYVTQCADIDEYVWEHPDFLPVIANGNAGDSGSQTVGAPATAKNVLSVGATQNDRTNGDGGWGNGNPSSIVLFSSRGPCADGRVKPDICAPGVGILSTRAYGVSYAYGEGSNTNYAYCSGTSMATPLTAGAAALVRQWLVERRGFTNAVPTAALVKAVLTGGAKGVSVPDHTFGWGRVDLGESLYPSNRAVRLIDRIPFAEDRTYACDVTLTNAAAFDVQLVWIDYPATAGAASTLVNDLDLVVSNRTTGATWFGNGTPGGDHTNTLESVRLADAEAGDYTVFVQSRTVYHASSEGGAAALYLRGAFADTGDVSETNETPETVRNEYVVDAARGDDATGTGTTNRPFATIAAALARVVAGDTVRVAPGAYAGCVTAPAAEIRIESTDGPAVTVIDGGGTNRCYDGSACTATILSGFTLTNGWVNASGGTYYGAGAYCGTLTNCLVTDCHVVDADETCNGYGYGGGAASATLVDCRIENCSAIYGGGGIYGCTASFCTIACNAADYYSNAYGGGASQSTLSHCTVYGNAAGGSGGGVDCDCTCTDAIVWGNTLASGVTSDWERYRGTATSFSYCCTTAGNYTDKGGNTNVSPRWAGAADGDFRLVCGSPCLDAASDSLNMGAWQGAGLQGYFLTAAGDGRGDVTPAEIFVMDGASATFTASTHHPFAYWETNGVAVANVATNVFIWSDIHADGTLTAHFRPTDFRVNAQTGNDNANGWTQTEAKRTIQEAVDVAADGETVWVDPGVYTGAIFTTAAKIDIRATGSPTNTFLVGDATNRCFEANYNPQTRLIGFTLMQGTSPNNHGGAVFCGTLSNCVIRNCQAGWGGGGVYKATLSDCIIADCVAGGQGGGACMSTLVNCTVRGCRAGALRNSRSTLAGGGVDYQCVCTNTILWGNTGPAGSEDNWEAYYYRERRTSQWLVPYFYWCCTTPYNSVSADSITDDPQFVSTDCADARLYEISPCIGAGANGANIGAYAGSGVVLALPELDLETATGEEVSNAVASVGYVDEDVISGIGTNAQTYAAFQTWSTNGLQSTAVVFSPRAFDSFRIRDLVSAPLLLSADNETTVELTALLPATDGTCSTTIRILDGDQALALGTAKEAFARCIRSGEEPDALATPDVSSVDAARVDETTVRLILTPPGAPTRQFMRVTVP